jgi:hypothetical protein
MDCSEVTVVQGAVDAAANVTTVHLSLDIAAVKESPVFIRSATSDVSVFLTRIFFISVSHFGESYPHRKNLLNCRKGLMFNTCV